MHKNWYFAKTVPVGLANKCECVYVLISLIVRIARMRQEQLV